MSRSISKCGLRTSATTDLKDVQVYFYLNGQGHVIQELPFPHLPAGQERTYVAQVTFRRDEEPKEKSLSPEQIQKELKERFQLVTAVIASTGNDGLLADNTRHAVVEVRKKLSVLVIPGPDEDVTKPPLKVNDTLLSPQAVPGVVPRNQLGHCESGCAR